MSAVALGQIDFGGPCKLTDPNGTIYFEDGVKVTPQPTYRQIPGSVSGDQDDTLVDLVWKITGRPKSIWNSTYRGVLLPDAYINWTAAGGRLCGTSNRSVAIKGQDAHGLTFTRCCVTKLVGVYLGLGESLYDEVEFTAFIGNGKLLTDTDAFYTENTTAWDQSDFPTGNQEALCNGAWGAVTGWDTLFAEKGFKLTHDLKTTPVKQGNITVDHRITGYRAMMSFTPEQPTTTQLLAALAMQGASAGIGTRRSANAADFVVAGSGISVTGKSMAVNKGEFIFDNKSNRHGEFGMITALTTPGTRLVFA